MFVKSKKSFIALSLISLALSISACANTSSKSSATSSESHSSITSLSSDSDFSSSMNSEISSSISSSAETISSSVEEISSSSIIESSKEEVTLLSISVVNNKDFYQIGDELDLTVKAHYSDGSEETLSQYQVSGFDNQYEGKQTVTISYLDQITTLEIEVVDINTFPKDKLQEYLDKRYIKTSVPVPFATSKWTSFERDYGDPIGYSFYAYTSDKTDSILDSYYKTLEKNEFIIDDSNYKTDLYYIASKNEVNVLFYTIDKTFNIFVYGEGQPDPIYIESLSLSGNTSLAKGRSTQLTVSYEPKDANQLDFTWSSSNEDVAKVNSGLVTAVDVGEALITVKGKNASGQDISASLNMTVTEAQLDAWTIMIYMCGSDLESDYSLATTDIEEILSVKNQPEDVNIIIETGGSTKWARNDIDAKHLNRYYVRNKTLNKEVQLANASMGKQSTFTSFLTWGLSTYPAEKTGVILWNHGGALDGVCSDDNYNGDTLLNSEVKGAFFTVFNELSITDKLEFIGYDACLMQLQDVAAFNVPYFNYMVGSEESEAGEGWAYDRWVPKLYEKKDTVTILKDIADGFVSSYTDTYGDPNDQTQSILDLSKFDAYQESFESLAVLIKNQVTSNNIKFKDFMKDNVKCYSDEYLDKKDMNIYINEYGYPSYWFDPISYEGQTYYLLHGYYLFATFDVLDFLNKYNDTYASSSIKTKISETKQALSELVIYNVAGDDAGESHGLALYCPIDEDYSFYTSKETSFTNWRSLVN